MQAFFPRQTTMTMQAREVLNVHTFIPRMPLITVGTSQFQR
ncbi:hypothetical protein BDE02_04G197900 [Populus trichocarpa]|nr:hypothetical protein BDE02_04G197900 [Populus trichocarpa]